MKLLIARRPVFDSFEKIFAYDLAVRGLSGSSGLYQDADPEQAIAQIFLDVGIDRIADHHSVLVTVSRDMLLRRSMPTLPPDRVILQIPLNVGVGAESRAACAELASEGHQLVVHVDPKHPEAAPLEFADVIKLDVTSVSPERLASLTDKLRVYRARMLAMNVRHRVERERCANLGFELFEGVRFSAPETLSRRDLGIEHLNTFRVLKLVRDPDANDQAIEELLQGDVALSYKLLRMVNSAATGAHDIRSIGHALRLIGREQLGRWLSILLVTDGGGSGVRAELIHLALVRARMCELFADIAGGRQLRGPLFLIGMVSVLDQLLEMPMDAVCDAMQLAPGLRSALLNRTDFLGTTLQLIASYVSGDWAEVAIAAQELAIEPSVLMPVYLDALSWATSNQRTERNAADAG